jgi:hypothetical protein
MRSFLDIVISCVGRRFAYGTYGWALHCMQGQSALPKRDGIDISRHTTDTSGQGRPSMLREIKQLPPRAQRYKARNSALYRRDDRSVIGTE